MYRWVIKNSLLTVILCGFIYSRVVCAAGDPGAGKRVFEEECSECHSLANNKKGPSLKAVFGRKAGSLADFTDYSDGMKNSGVIWSDAALDQYLTMPRKFVPGAKMKYEGLADAKARADLIAFISTVK
jgi:cytochrome c